MSAGNVNDHFLHIHRNSFYTASDSYMKYMSEKGSVWYEETVIAGVVHLFYTIVRSR